MTLVCWVLDGWRLRLRQMSQVSEASEVCVCVWVCMEGQRRKDGGGRDGRMKWGCQQLITLQVSPEANVTQMLTPVNEMWSPVQNLCVCVCICLLKWVWWSSTKCNFIDGCVPSTHFKLLWPLKRFLYQSLFRLLMETEALLHQSPLSHIENCTPTF